MSTAVADASAALREALLRGKQDLLAELADASVLSLRAGEVFPKGALGHNRVYRLQAGWACQFTEVPRGRRAIIDIYLPGDFLGLDVVVFKTRPVENVLAVTSVETEVFDNRHLRSDAIASPSAALFVAWLLERRQQRADRLLAAISGCDARGRMAMMVLDLHKRLRARKLITANTFNLPMT